MKKFLLSLLILSVSISCNQPKNTENEKTELIINIKSVAGKSKTEVDKVLGKPEKVEPFSETICKTIACEKAYYKNAKFEIILLTAKQIGLQ